MVSAVNERLKKAAPSKAGAAVPLTNQKALTSGQAQ